MQLKTLIEEMTPVRLSGVVDETAEVKGLSYDSRKVEPGGIFFALRGERADGHDFIDQALAGGAIAVVMEQPHQLPSQVAGIEVANCREALALAAAAFYGHPTRTMTVVGITGTNGKTTSTYLLEAILQEAGRKPAVFGTINYRFSGQCLPSAHTTPESLDLLASIASFARQGADALVLEVSSHALAQHRADGLDFSVGIFTNLTPEHLDYHRDMEGYFASKRRFFTELLPRTGGRAAINVDDPYGRRLAGELPQALTFGSAENAAVRPLAVEMSLEGIHGRLTTPAGEVALASSLVGAFNLQNLLAATAAAVAVGIAPEVISRGLEAAPQVPGRMERIENGRGAAILVDYAHTGDALEKALLAVKGLDPRRILTVCGCGGDRDRSKRPVMGEVACRHSDLVVVTSDNPRSEAPQAIMEEIYVGCQRIHRGALTLEQASASKKAGYVGILDRREAIRFAVSCLEPQDVLLVAGKGHEDYQIIGGQRLHFDDREEVRSALAALEEGR